MSEPEVFEVQGERITYKLRKPRIGDWKEYYKRRKEYREMYGDDRDAENFGLSVLLVERCLIEPTISVDDIPFNDFVALSQAIMERSAPSPLLKKPSRLT